MVEKSSTAGFLVSRFNRLADEDTCYDKGRNAGYFDFFHQYRRKQDNEKNKCKNEYRVGKWQVKVLKDIAPGIIAHIYLKIIIFLFIY